MPKYQTNAIDETAFLVFVNSPSPKLLKKFLKELSSDGQANSFFEEEPPVWIDDPAEWVKAHLRKDDWYIGLTEPEALAWDSAIRGVCTQFDFDKKVKSTAWGAIHFCLFEFAEEVFQSDKVNHQMLRMTPYRYYSLAPEIENTERYERIYWPSHAMLDTQQLAAVANDLQDLLIRLPSFDMSSADIFSTIQERRNTIESEAQKLVSYIGRLLDANAMWFANIDC